MQKKNASTTIGNTTSIFSLIFARKGMSQIKEAAISMIRAPAKGNIKIKLFSRVSLLLTMPSTPTKKKNAPAIKALTCGLVCAKQTMPAIADIITITIKVLIIFFKPDVSFITLNDKMTLFTIEPPCGSNTYVLQTDEELLFVDCGFACYRSEMVALFKELFHGYSTIKKSAFITHGDLDHVGILSEFDAVYMSGNCYDNFVLDVEGKEDFREQNPLHEPYCRLSRIISGYVPPALEKCIVIGKREGDEILAPIGSHFFGGKRFDFYEGKGGHVRGDTVIVCDELKLVFSGDIYVNIKGFSNEQKEFNALAPFLMTGVDSDPKLAREARDYLVSKYSDYIICPGHGAVKKF